MKKLVLILVLLVVSFTLANAEEWNTIWKSNPQIPTYINFAPDDLTIGTLGSDGFVAVRTEDGKILKKLGAQAFCYSQDSKYLIILFNYIVYVYNNNTWELLKTIPTNLPTYGTKGLTISPDNSTIVVFINDYLTFIDFEAGIIKHQTRDWEHQNIIDISSIYYINSSDKILFTAFDDLTRIMNTKNYNVEEVLKCGTYFISKNGRLRFFPPNNTDTLYVQIQDLITKKIISEIHGVKGIVNTCAVSPDNYYFSVAVSDGIKMQIEIFDVNTQKNVFNYTENPKRGFRTLAWSYNGKYLAGSSYDTLFLYKAYPLVGVDEKVINEDTIIYPNPTSDYLTININNIIFEKISGSIYNEVGEIIKTISSNELSFNGNTLKIDVSSLESGIYFLQLFKGNTFSSFKFVKE